MMRKLLRNNRGGATVEFALVSLPVIFFVFGIIQTAWIIWADNLLNIAVDTAARCGGVGSTTAPCAGTDMISAANQVFAALGGATFANNTSCSSGVGLVGTYNVTIGWVVNLTITAQSCYPSVS